MFEKQLWMSDILSKDAGIMKLKYEINKCI